jgi:hypothetical protein
MVITVIKTLNLWSDKVCLHKKQQIFKHFGKYTLLKVTGLLPAWMMRQWSSVTNYSSRNLTIFKMALLTKCV